MSKSYNSRRNRAIGSSTAAATAIAAFLSAAPAAHADFDFDLPDIPVIDLGVVPGDAAAFDLGGSIDGLFSDAYYDIGRVIETLMQPIGALGQLLLPPNPDLTPGLDWGADPFAGVGQMLSIWLDDAWIGLHGGMQDLINGLDPIMAPINSLFAIGGACGLICNGADGTVDGAAQSGGWLFGDGGAGFDGSDGGNAGLL